MNYKIAEPKMQYDKDDNIIDKILKIRGIEDKDKFLFPSEDVLHSPWELSSMKEAVKEIIYAIENNLKIGVYGDIDCDGVTSLAIIYHYLKEQNNIPIKLYHQRKKGHGVIVDNVPKDLDLLIIVDSSSNCVDECKQLSEYMNIVILDHHLSDVENPYATIVNPQFNDYPNKFLSGAGVCYKTCKAMDEVLCTDFADKFIDICAVGMIGDMMDVTNLETRHLILKGLFKIHNNCGLQLKLILKHLKKDFRPNSTTIGFYLAPFINSIIRLNQIEDIITILTSDDEKLIKETIKKCDKLNTQRKAMQSKIVGNIEKTIDTSHKVIFEIVESEDDSQTLNGLVANNIMQKYKKPTFILCKNKEKNTYVGSGRSLGDIDIRKLMIASNLIIEAEGHEGAFGVEVECDKLEQLVKYLDNELKDVEFDNSILVDLELKPQDITWELLNDLQKLSFIVGEGFREPQFLVKCLFRTEEATVMKDIHVKLKAGEFDCLKFNLSQSEVETLKNTFCFDVIGGLAINSWYNFKTKETVKSKQILINDLHIY
jgi:single-stranded-DNA-specific exonuclease